MLRRLPLLEPHTREHTYCAYCPKLCRFACPVSTVEARETTTPWGKMTSLHHVAEGNLELAPAHASTWYACTGCMRCKTFCEHDNEVASTLDAGRAVALAGGAAPAAAREVVARHRAREARARERGQALFGQAGREPQRTVYFPGCTATAVRPEDARAGFEVTRALAGPTMVRADLCCGLPLLEAGDTDGFIASAGRLIDTLAGASRVVFLDPGCMHALRTHAPRLGVDHDLPLVHVTELAADHLTRLAPVPIEGEVRYHDACRLGRGLGIYEPPRAVLRHLLGRPAAELPAAREGAECSGAGGQLPRTFPETATAIAEERLREHREAGGGTLVTACPGAARHLEARTSAAPGPRVRSLVALLAEAIAR